jgi:hypothetical protein
MTGLTFAAWRGDAYLWLPEVVGAVLPLVAGCTWKAALEDWTPGPGPSESELEALRGGLTLSTDELLRVFSSPVQVIDGEITALESDGAVVAVFRAVDSTGGMFLVAERKSWLRSRAASRTRRR